MENTVGVSYTAVNDAVTVVAQDAEETAGALRIMDGVLQQEMSLKQYLHGGGTKHVLRWVDVPNLTSKER